MWGQKTLRAPRNFSLKKLLQFLHFSKTPLITVRRFCRTNMWEFEFETYNRSSMSCRNLVNGCSISPLYLIVRGKIPPFKCAFEAASSDNYMVALWSASPTEHKVWLWNFANKHTTPWQRLAPHSWEYGRNRGTTMIKRRRRLLAGAIRFDMSIKTPWTSEVNRLGVWRSLRILVFYIDQCRLLACVLRGLELLRNAIWEMPQPLSTALFLSTLSVAILCVC